MRLGSERDDRIESLVKMVEQNYLYCRNICELDDCTSQQMPGAQYYCHIPRKQGNKSKYIL
jgi:hypothetical protein